MGASVEASNVLEELPNPERLLRALDQFLDHRVTLILYGRSAIWLGFSGAPLETAKTMDVDAIITDAQLQSIIEDGQFWDAIEAVKKQFKEDQIYITHLFRENQIFLRTNWLSQIVQITKLDFRFLQLYRPAAVDLVLTKMMRGDDEQDLTDADFIIRHDKITVPQLLDAFDQMKPIELDELQDAFKRAKPRVLELARRASMETP